METKNDMAIEAAATEKSEKPATTEKKKRGRKPKVSPATENMEAVAAKAEADEEESKINPPSDDDKNDAIEGATNISDDPKLKLEETAESQPAEVENVNPSDMDLLLSTEAFENQSLDEMLFSALSKNDEEKLQDSVEHSGLEATDEDADKDSDAAKAEAENTALRLRDLIDDQLTSDIADEKEEDYGWDDEFLDIPDIFTEDDTAEDIPFSEEDEASSLAALLYDDDEFTITEDSENGGPVSFAQLRIEMQKIRDDARELRGEPEEIPEPEETAEEIEGQISLDEKIDEIESVHEDEETPLTSEEEKSTEEITESLEAKEEKPKKVAPAMVATVSKTEEATREHIITINRDKIKEKSTPKDRLIDGAFEVVELFVFTLLIIMFITTFVFRHSVVEGSSMESTLFGGDHLIISDLFYEPEKGDIVICDDKSKGLFGITSPIVKRVIALEGDTIRIDIYGQVYVNDILLEEDYLDPDMKVAARNEEYVLTVPEGQVFVLGDNRFYSKDSDEFGPIDEDSILGKVILRFYPFDKIKVFN